MSSSVPPCMSSVADLRPLPCLMVYAPWGISLLHDDRAGDHVHPARERVRARLERAELDGLGTRGQVLGEPELLALYLAGAAGGLPEGDLSGNARLQVEHIGVVRAARQVDGDLLHAARYLRGAGDGGRRRSTTTAAAAGSGSAERAGATRGSGRAGEARGAR